MCRPCRSCTPAGTRPGSAAGNTEQNTQRPHGDRVAGQHATGATSPDPGEQLDAGVAQLQQHPEQQVYVGKFAVSQPGYQKIVLQGVSASADVFADIDDILIGGSAVGSDTYFIKDEFYWGRRGPSVHLNYQSPTSAPLEYFYSELTVPAGQDVIGSYYMANGFGQGYFGRTPTPVADAIGLNDGFSFFRIAFDPAIGCSGDFQAQLRCLWLSRRLLHRLRRGSRFFTTTATAACA